MTLPKNKSNKAMKDWINKEKKRRNNTLMGTDFVPVDKRPATESRGFKVPDKKAIQSQQEAINGFYEKYSKESCEDEQDKD